MALCDRWKTKYPAGTLLVAMLNEIEYQNFREYLKNLCVNEADQNIKMAILITPC